MRIAGLLLASALVAGAAVATAAWDSGAGRSRVSTYKTYFEDGQKNVVDHLSGAGAEGEALLDAMNLARDDVVRVRVHYDRRGGTVTTAHGSGFLLRGGAFVVTAAHVLAILESRDDAEIEVAFPGGAITNAMCVERTPVADIDADNDWAVLAVPPVDGEGRGLVVDAAWGRAGPVAALGFPEQLGLAEDGSVVRDRTEHGFVMRALAVIAHFDGPRGLAVDAGAVPLGGISGGPVVNGAGHVVAIDTGVRSHRAKGGDVTWSLVVNELDGLAEWLREKAPQALFVQ